MKLKALVLVSFLTASTAFAQFVPSRVAMNVLPGVVTAEVFNPYFQPIICSGQVFGQLATGEVLTTYFYEQILPIGGYRYAYVNSGFLPLVTGWANINCRYPGIW